MAKKPDKKQSAGSLPKGTIVLTRKKLLFWAIGVVGMAGWMFFLGVIVGRGTAPVRFDIEKLQRELISVKGELFKQEKEEARIETKKISEEPDLDFYAKLTEKKEQARLKQAAPVRKEQPPEPVIPKEMFSKKNAGRLILQVASLKDSKKAEDLIRDLRKKGYDASKHRVQIPGRGTWNRICVGPFSTNSEAQQALTRLRKEENLDPILVKGPRAKEKE